MLGSFRALAHGPFDGTGSTSAGIACTPATEERSGGRGTGERFRALIITGCDHDKELALWETLNNVKEAMPNQH